MELSIFDLIAVLFGLVALFGYINHKVLGLPHSIGLMVIALGAALTLVAFELVFPATDVDGPVTAALRQVDFDDTLLKGMLSFLLFAGALHVDLTALRSRLAAITAMATLGVLISTFVVGTLAWLVFGLLGLEIPFIWALAFGALISPTDPVAVLGVLKTIKVPASVEAKIAGESLFNDGVGVVVFLIVVAIAAGGPHAEVGPLEVARLFAQEAGGGAVLGAVAGYIAYRALGSLDEHNLEIMITLALVTVTYALAHLIHVSGPLAVVVAGIFIGNHGVAYAMSEKTREHLLNFWELLDEILNSLLFLLIGLEVLVVRVDLISAEAALLAIPIVLLGRFFGVSIPLTLLSLRQSFTKGAIPVLVWGGLRGGISVALALSLPEGPEKAPILAITYAVVIFSIIVQGLTFRAVVKRSLKGDA
ncbi:sodium:proton antiporter [Pelagibius sp. CAU 1746]|uniref:cation:proton antiporter n=1 Tax=Pelagibius sp. CAU 1746 TaxID=3140370 RepID=UPI00325B424B